MSEDNIKENNEIIFYSVPKFKTLDEFEMSANYGGEIQFLWKEKEYGIFRMPKNENSPEQYVLCECYYDKDGKRYNAGDNEEVPQDDEQWADTVDELLEFRVGGDRLRDIITKAEIFFRNL